MKIEQIYTGCLSQGAYYIESDGEVAIIDPLREIQPYMDRASNDHGTIKYIFETHFHADFVSGHLSLAKETGASIVFGPTANPSFEAIIAEDGQVFKLGKITIEALHTPGHTMESTTYLLRDEQGNDHAIFSGDTLFLGDVGRPDLAQKANEFSQEDLAGILYDSLRNKIMPLSDSVIVYPAHGAGSACGKHMMKETIDTLGSQKRLNYALRVDMTKEEFIKEVTDGLLPPPMYFPMNVKMNKEGYDDIGDVITRGSKGLLVDEFDDLRNNGEAIVLDVRHQSDFIKGHIPGSIFIGLHGGFAPWVGTLIANVKQSILLVTPSGKEQETVIRLSRVGFDHALGYLEGGYEAWKSAGKETDTLESITALQFRNELREESIVYDVRTENEYKKEHLKEARLTPLSYINDFMNEYPRQKPFYMHCAGGYRSVIAASILKSRGIHNIIEVAGGFTAMKTTGIPIVKQ